MTIYLSEHDAARLGIGGAKPRTKRGRNTRPDIPSAGRAESVGLNPLIVAGWSTEFCVGKGHKMYKINGPTTGYHSDLAAAAQAAKELTK